MKKLLLILMLLIPGLLFAQNYIRSYEMGDEAARGKLNAVLLSATTLTTGTFDVDSINNSGDLVVAGSSTFADPVSLDSTLMLGTFGDTQQILATEATNTSPLLGVFPMVNFVAGSGKVYAGIHSRMLFNASQTNGVNGFGMESQLRLKGANLAGQYHGGLWAYAEQSGTTTLSGGGYFTGLFSMIESASTLTAGATSENICGIVIDGAIDAGATIDVGTNFSGLFIESRGLDFFDGIYITGATNDIKLQNAATIENAVNGTMTLTEPIVAVAGDLTVSGGISQTATVYEYTTIVTIDSTQIAGEASGDLNHADGHVLVASPGTGYALEFVSAFIIYDHSTADFGGGGDDLVIQVGVNGAQVAMSSALSQATLLTGSADAMMRVSAIPTETVYSDAGIISLYAGTELTNDGGTAAGLLRVHITYRVHTTGL